jgi:hypothetical protein
MKIFNFRYGLFLPVFKGKSQGGIRDWALIWLGDIQATGDRKACFLYETLVFFY